VLFHLIKLHQFVKHPFCWFRGFIFQLLLFWSKE